MQWTCRWLLYISITPKFCVVLAHSTRITQHCDVEKCLARAIVKLYYFLIASRDCDMRCEGSKTNHSLPYVTYQQYNEWLARRRVAFQLQCIHSCHILPRCIECNAILVIVKPSVRLSVRPTNARIVTERKHLAKKVQLWLIVDYELSIEPKVDWVRFNVPLNTL